MTEQELYKIMTTHPYRAYSESMKQYVYIVSMTISYKSCETVGDVVVQPVDSLERQWCSLRDLRPLSILDKLLYF